MIEVHAWRTSNGLRATVALAESGLPHRVIPVDLGAKAQKTDAYLRLNPAGQIPTMVDPDGPGGQPLVLAQSGAIVLYACVKSGRHMPADPAVHARAMQWFMQAATDVGGASAGLHQVENVAPEKVESTVQLFRNRLLNYFGLADRQLQSSEYLAGPLTFADLMLYPNYALRRDLVDGQGLAALEAWGRRMAEREGVRQGMAFTIA